MPKIRTDRIMGLAFEFGRLMRHQMTSGPGEMNFLQLFALGWLHEHAGSTMKELADQLKITSPSATSFVNRLVALGWVRRVPDPRNRKLVRLQMTAKGKNILKGKFEQRRALINGILRRIPQQDQLHLERILTHLIQAFPIRTI